MSGVTLHWNSAKAAYDTVVAHVAADPSFWDRVRASADHVGYRGWIVLAAGCGFALLCWLIGKASTELVVLEHSPTEPDWSVFDRMEQAERTGRKTV